MRGQVLQIAMRVAEIQIEPDVATRIIAIGGIRALCNAFRLQPVIANVEYTLYLLTLYAKSETSSIAAATLKEIRRALET